MKDTNGIEVGYCRTLGHRELHGKDATCVDWQSRPHVETDVYASCALWLLQLSVDPLLGV